MEQSIWVKTWDYVLDFIYPKECVGCGKEGNWLCDNCRKKIVKIKTSYCPFCRQITQKGQFCSNCRRKTALTGIIISAHYREGPLKEMIHAYKYDSIRALGQELAEIICERLKNNLPSGEKIVIPIPLHSKKEKERGFNQALFLAQIISQKLNLPLEKNTLIRTKNTKAQIKLKKKERIKNMRRAFVCSLPQKVRGKTILLIDDVATTGTTLNEAAKILRKFGARQVWGVTIAQG